MAAKSVSEPLAKSAVAWEDRFLTFLGTELAPIPGRVRATARIVIACLVATTLIMTLHPQQPAYAIIAIFVVSQTNIGTSLQRAVLRIIGTLMGGSLGLVAHIAFLDHPVLRVALMGLLSAFLVFLSRTTTAPDIGLIGGITAVWVMTVADPDPNTSVQAGLWVVAMALLGVVIITGAQMLLWPNNPGEQLRASLTERMAAIEELANSMGEVSPPNLARLDNFVLTGLSQQLNLLEQFEARHPTLREHDAGQVAVIAGIEQLLTAAVAFAHASVGREAALQTEPMRRRLAEISVRCEWVRQALIIRKPVAPPIESDARSADARIAEAGGAPMLPALLEMERALSFLLAAAGRVDSELPDEPAGLVLDPPSWRAFLSPALSLNNGETLGFILRSGIAATLAYVIYQGLAWPGLQTSVWTTLLITQSTIGASLRRALLRLAGVTLGGGLGLLTILWIMPNIDNLTPLLLVTGGCTTVAAWLAAGGPRIAYVGLQTGVAVALCFLGDLGPTTDLVPARDRVIGVLLGIGVSLLVFEIGGHVYALTEMRRSLAGAVRALANLARSGVHRRSPITAATVIGWRRRIYENFATTLRLHDESKYEWGAERASAQAERARVARLTTDAQTIFLALLALVRHRLNVDIETMPATVQEALRALGDGVVMSLDALASRIEGRTPPEAPELGRLLAQAEAAIGGALPGLDANLRTHLPGRLAVYRDLVGRIAQFEGDVGLQVSRQ